VTKEDEPFAVGELIYLTSGVYSAFGVLGVYKVLKAFYANTFDTNNAPGYFKTRIDYTRLETEGFIEPLAARELWTGDN
jgi:hypothetical protein